MPWYSAFLITLATVVTMEFVAWAMHKYVMHGFLWYLHEDHHRVHPEHFFEKNDAFFLIFAVPSMLLLWFGADGYPPIFWIGLGIAIYGAMYFFVHDIFIHQRFKVLRNTNSVYFRALRKGHKVHHKKQGKEDGECFGMLLVPMKYFRDARRAARAQRG